MDLGMENHLISASGNPFRVAWLSSEGGGNLLMSQIMVSQILEIFLKMNIVLIRQQIR